MTRISVMYPNQMGVRFDFDYYLNRHIPLARKLLGAAVHAVTVEQGINPGLPWPAPAYICIAHFDCASLNDYQGAIAPYAAQLENDLANYSNISPVIQVSELCNALG